MVRDARNLANEKASRRLLSEARTARNSNRPGRPSLGGVEVVTYGDH